MSRERTIPTTQVLPTTPLVKALECVARSLSPFNYWSKVTKTTQVPTQTKPYNTGIQYVCQRKRHQVGRRTNGSELRDDLAIFRFTEGSTEVSPRQLGVITILWVHARASGTGGTSKQPNDSWSGGT